MDFNILGVGNPFFDRTVHVDRLPEDLVKGNTSIVPQKSDAEKSWAQAWGENLPFEWSFGGSCTNVIKSLANLGNFCALLGKIGKDRKAEVEERLRQIGVTSLLTEGNREAGFVNCFITSDGDRTMQAYLGASVELLDRDIQPEHFKKVSHVHLEGYLSYFEQVLETSIQIARENQAKVSLDLSSIDVVKEHRMRFLECARQVNYLFGNLQEMQALTERENIDDILKKIDAPFTTVVITTGSDGGWVKPNNSIEATKFEAIRLDASKIKDTTGAGDFFLAGFLHGAIQKKSLEMCVKIARLAASFVIQVEGTELSKEQWQKLKNEIAIINLEENKSEKNKVLDLQIV